MHPPFFATHVLHVLCSQALGIAGLNGLPPFRSRSAQNRKCWHILQIIGLLSCCEQFPAFPQGAVICPFPAVIFYPPPFFFLGLFRFCLSTAFRPGAKRKRIASTERPAFTGSHSKRREVLPCMSLWAFSSTCTRNCRKSARNDAGGSSKRCSSATGKTTSGVFAHDLRISKSPWL